MKKEEINYENLESLPIEEKRELLHLLADTLNESALTYHICLIAGMAERYNCF